MHTSQYRWTDLVPPHFFLWQPPGVQKPWIVCHISIVFEVLATPPRRQRVLQRDPWVKPQSTSMGLETCSWHNKYCFWSAAWVAWVHANQTCHSSLWRSCENLDPSTHSFERKETTSGILLTELPRRPLCDRPCITLPRSAGLHKAGKYCASKNFIFPWVVQLPSLSSVVVLPQYVYSTVWYFDGSSVPDDCRHMAVISIQYNLPRSTIRISDKS